MRSRLLPLLALLGLALFVPAALASYAQAPAYAKGNAYKQIVVGVSQDGNHVNSISEACGRNGAYVRGVSRSFTKPRAIGRGGRLSFSGKGLPNTSGTSAPKKVKLSFSLHFVSKSLVLVTVKTPICNKGNAIHWRAVHINGG